MSTETVQIQQNKYDHSKHIEKVFHILNRYKYSIVFTTLFFSAATYAYLYFKPDIYKTYATVEVGKNSSSQDDVLSQFSDSMSLDTEVDIIKSRFVMYTALKDIDFTHKYYAVKNYKEIELYKESPFSVELTKGFGLLFTIKPLSNQSSFELIAEGKEHGETWKYNKIHKYADKISDAHFALTVRKNKAMELNESEYRFRVYTKLSSLLMAMQGIDIEHSDGYSNVIKITNEDNVPLRAQEVVNALARAYLQQNIDKKTAEATKMLEFIDLQLDQYQL